MPIVINSKSCSNAGWWAGHLQKTETNERVEVIGFYDLSAESIEDAFSEMRVMAQGSKRTTNFFSQYNINPRADEHLTEAQWEEAHALHRKNHGLDHLPYFRVRHIKEGRVHEHGIALRVDPETRKAISDSLTAPVNERTARSLEIKFDLERGHSILTANREQERPARRPKKRESFRDDERGGIDPATVKADALAAKQQADNGQSFKTALEASGNYVLARGDRRDFVIIDRAGDDHSLGRRLGMKTAELRAFMQDVDPASLPSVEQAKAMQRARQVQHKIQPEPSPPVAAAPIYDDDDSRRRKKVASEREDASDPKVQKKQVEDQQDFAAQAREQTELSERFLAGVRSAQEEGERIKAAEAAAGQRAAQDDDIADARSRYAQAAGERYDIRRPYSSLSEVVGLEGAMFQREQEKLKREAALERDPEKRELIELRRQIEANDYMAITSHRCAEMSKVITGHGNSEEGQWQEQRSQNFAAEALELRRQRQEAQDRIRERDEARAAEAVNQRGGGTGAATGQDKATGAAPSQDNQPVPEAAREAAQAPEAANEPWMMQRGGAAGLSGEYRASAERSYERWSERNPELGQRHGFADYVGYVQGKWAEELRASQPAHDAAQEAAQAPEAARAAVAPGQPDRPASEAERPAEIIFASPARPEPVTQEAAREITDARQAESATAENVEITDSKAAKKAAWAQHHAETEQSIEQGQERGHGYSR